MEKFTIEEIRNYIQSQDSLGDVLYYLSTEKIREANEDELSDDQNTIVEESERAAKGLIPCSDYRTGYILGYQDGANRIAK